MITLWFTALIQYIIYSMLLLYVYTPSRVICAWSIGFNNPYSDTLNKIIPRLTERVEALE